MPCNKEISEQQHEAIHQYIRSMRGYKYMPDLVQLRAMEFDCMSLTNGCAEIAQTPKIPESWRKAWFKEGMPVSYLDFAIGKGAEIITPRTNDVIIINFGVWQGLGYKFGDDCALVVGTSAKFHLYHTLIEKGMVLGAVKLE